MCVFSPDSSGTPLRPRAASVILASLVVPLSACKMRSLILVKRGSGWKYTDTMDNAQWAAHFGAVGQPQSAVGAECVDWLAQCEIVSIFDEI